MRLMLVCCVIVVVVVVVFLVDYMFCLIQVIEGSQAGVVETLNC